MFVGLVLVILNPGGVTVTPSVALSAHGVGGQGEVPVTVAVAVPPGAVADATRAILDVVGEVEVIVEVTPVGRPAMVTVTAPVNPLAGEIVAVTAWLPPRASDTVVGLTAIVNGLQP